MGRKNLNGRVPQNNRGEAQREIRRSMHLHGFPNSFGIRRPLEASLNGQFHEGLVSLQRFQDLPHHLAIRDSFHATLLPKRVFGRQILRGLTLGFNLHTLQNRFDQQTNGAKNNTILADIKGANIFKGRILNLILESEEMEEDREVIHTVMAEIGLKGLKKAKDEVKLHMSLGDTRGSLTPTEQRHMVHTVDEMIIDNLKEAPNGLSLEFEQWQFYPDLNLWTN